MGGIIDFGIIVVLTGPKTHFEAKRLVIAIVLKTVSCDWTNHARMRMYQ